LPEGCSCTGIPRQFCLYFAGKTFRVSCLSKVRWEKLPWLNPNVCWLNLEIPWLNAEVSWLGTILHLSSEKLFFWHKNLKNKLG